MATADPDSYIDYAALTSPTFSPTSHANALILQTNHPSDTPLDLSTPLSRALFDAQEIDTRLEAVTATHAAPLLASARTRRDAAAHLLAALDPAVAALTAAHARLQAEVATRHAAADALRVAAERALQALRLAREVQRVAALARQLQARIEELTATAAAAAAPRNAFWAMVPAAEALLALRRAFAQGEEVGQGLGRVAVVATLRQEIVAPGERFLLARAQQVVREFSMSSLMAAGAAGGGGAAAQTFAQTEEMKHRATSALQTLYLLSPVKAASTNAVTATTPSTFEPTLLVAALQSYLQTALTSSLAALTRALATLPTLDRALLEISARCQNIVALEALLASIRPPPHPLLTTTTSPENPTSAATTSGDNFLAPLLRHLDTSSLPSYFWRSMAGQLAGRVQEILVRGGVSARTLRSNRERVRDAIRECVDRGSRLPVSSGLGPPGRKGADAAAAAGNWEREAAVMVQSVVGPLMR